MNNIKQNSRPDNFDGTNNPVYDRSIILKSSTNPNYIGPGNWHSLHLMSANAKTKEQKESVLWFIKILSENFYCKKCKDDFLIYLKNDNPKNYLNSDEGLFFWSFKFHNFVNNKLGKPIMTYEDAKNLYFSPETCLTSCSANKETYTFVKMTPNIEKTTNSIIKPYK